MGTIASMLYPLPALPTPGLTFLHTVLRMELRELGRGSLCGQTRRRTCHATPMRTSSSTTPAASLNEHASSRPEQLMMSTGTAHALRPKITPPTSRRRGRRGSESHNWPPRTLGASPVGHARTYESADRVRHLPGLLLLWAVAARGQLDQSRLAAESTGQSARVADGHNGVLHAVDLLTRTADRTGAQQQKPPAQQHARHH